MAEKKRRYEFDTRAKITNSHGDQVGFKIINAGDELIKVVKVVDDATYRIHIYPNGDITIDNGDQQACFGIAELLHQPLQVRLTGRGNPHHLNHPVKPDPKPASD